MSDDQAPQPDDPTDEQEPTEQTATEPVHHDPGLQDPDGEVTENAGSEHFTGESYRNTLRLN